MSVKSAEEMMEILEAFDLVGTLRGAAVLAGCDHKTVATCVRLRDEAAGAMSGARERARPTVDPFAGRSRSGCSARAGGSAPIARMSGWS